MFGPCKDLVRRYLGVQTPTQKVFGRLGLGPQEIGKKIGLDAMVF